MYIASLSKKNSLLASRDINTPTEIVQSLLCHNSQDLFKLSLARPFGQPPTNWKRSCNIVNKTIGLNSSPSDEPTALFSGKTVM